MALLTYFKGISYGLAIALLFLLIRFFSGEWESSSLFSTYSYMLIISLGLFAIFSWLILHNSFWKGFFIAGFVAFAAQIVIQLFLLPFVLASAATGRISPTLKAINILLYGFFLTILAIFPSRLLKKEGDSRLTEGVLTAFTFIFIHFSFYLALFSKY